MPAEMSRNAKILATLGIALAMFLAALDQTIVGTALPRIVAELQGLDYYAWVATSYMVASTTMTPISGKLGDLFGRRSALLVGIVGFVLASALCGQAQDMTQLIAFRGVQGLFGGVLFSNVFASVADLFDPKTRARVQGIFGGIFGIASVVGPVVGGYLTDNLSWRWVFYVNVPVGIIALAAVFFFLPSVAHKASWRDIDFLGAGTLAATLVPLLVGFSITRDHDWVSPEVLGLLAFAAIMGVIFFLIERREKHAIVPFGLWKNRTFAVSMTTSFLVAFGMFGAILYVPLIYQGILGIAATNSGLLITPMMVGLISGSILTGQIITRIDRYRLVGTVATMVMLSGLWLLGQVSVDTKEIEVVRDLVLVGLGLGATFPLYINASQAAVPRQYLGVVSSQIQFWRNIGGTIGVAIFGAVLSHDLPKKIQENIAALNLPPAIVSNLSASTSPQAIFDPARIAALRASVPPALEPVIDQILIAVRAALASTIHEVFFYATLIVGIAAVVSVFLKEVPIRGHTPREQQETRDAEAREEAPAFGA
jgi:EmrB/QacA subfamily drug resistance transporter